MEAIRYVETVEGDSLTLKNLSRFDGEKVEVIIIPIESSEDLQFEEEWNKEIQYRLEKFNSAPETVRSYEDVLIDARKILKK